MGSRITTADPPKTLAEAEAHWYKDCLKVSLDAHSRYLDLVEGIVSQNQAEGFPLDGCLDPCCQGARFWESALRGITRGMEARG